MTPAQIEEHLAEILPRVSKPGRYTGGEYNQIQKDWSQVDIKVALAFPDIYDLGMSNLGLMILYDIINKHRNLLAERTYSPWIDMEDQLRDRSVPLFSLESKRAIKDFDLLGISLPYEQLFTNTLNLLDLAGMPIRSTDRDASCPLVVAGGHACFNPEPMAPFIDVFVIGEGEEVILEIIGALRSSKDLTRDRQLERIAQIPGCYVPRFYQAEYHADGTVAGTSALNPSVPERVQKRIVPVLPPPVTNFIVPFIDVVHNRAPIEIMRGCTRGCRFCHAGMITRPVRERPVAEILEAMDQIIEKTGYEEISLLSLSSSDYTDILELTRQIGQKYKQRGLKLSLPSLRIESVSTQLMDNIGAKKRGGFTLAPEAATEKMRNIINKYVSDQELLETVREIYSRDWRTIKLYFMIGHPQESLEDVKAIADLARAVLREGRKIHGRKAKVNVGVSTFIPKPHTPFQWEPMDTMDQIMSKIKLLRRELRGHGLNLRWNEPLESILEGFLSRGDRRVAEVVEEAWRRGAKFDGWYEHFDMERWHTACQDQGLEMSFYSHRRRTIDEVFPWEHIDVVVKRSFLTQDYLMSQEGQTRIDCRDQCFACGILPAFKEIRKETPAEAWECPPVLSVQERRRRKAAAIPLRVKG